MSIQLNIEQKILSSANALFSARLYVDVSIMDIVNSAGVGRGSFYNYFTTKDECFVKCAVPIIQSVSNTLLEYRYQVGPDNLAMLLEKNISIMYEKTMIFRNTNAFMYATENEMLRHMLYNAYKVMYASISDVYMEYIRNMPSNAGTVESELVIRAKAIAGYIISSSHMAMFDAIAPLGIMADSASAISLKPEDFLKLIT